MHPDERAEARIINKNKILVVLSKIEDEHLMMGLKSYSLCQRMVLIMVTKTPVV